MDAYLIEALPSFSFSSSSSPLPLTNEKIIFWDVQGYRGHQNEFVLKEMAFLSLDQTLKFHTIYKPPFSKIYYPFSSSTSYTNSYIQNHLHNIKWDSGEFDYDSVIDHIEPIVNYKPQYIYVKGYEKIKYFLNLYCQNLKIDTPIPKVVQKKYNFINNIESDFEIPNLKDLRTLYENKNIFCRYHDTKKYQCAKAHVQMLRWFYLENRGV